MRRITASLLMFVAVCTAAAFSTESPSIAKAARAGRTITGTVVGLGGRYGGRSRAFTLYVNSPTTPGQVQDLNDALQKGEDELLKTLSGMNAGRISLGNNVGVTANAIIETPQAEGGSKLIVLYERTINFFELRRGSRSEDYRFGYAEIYLGRDGKGEGTLIPAARVKLQGGNTWVVEDFGEFPARLMGLRSRGSVTAR